MLVCTDVYRVLTADEQRYKGHDSFSVRVTVFAGS